MANFIKTHSEEHIQHIMLNRGRSNPLHLEILQELKAEFIEVENNPALEAVVLTGNEGFFSSGLDLITLYDYDEIQLEAFWVSLLDLVEYLITFRKPFVAAISGHSPAGGCLLSLAADYRIMADGDYIIGLNEVPVGIIVPNGVFDLYGFWIGRSRAYSAIMEGKLFSPKEALDIGLVDELTPLNRIQSAAVRKCKTFMQFEKEAWSQTKLNLRKGILESLRDGRSESLKQSTEQWWKPKTRAIMKTIIENLTSKKPS